VADDPAYGRLDRATDERFTRFCDQLGIAGFGFNQITLRRGQRWRVHRHRDQDEAYVVLEGELTLVVEGGRRVLRRDDVAYIPPPVKRQLVNEGPETCVLLAIGAAPPHERWDAEAFHSWDDPEPHAPQDVPIPDDLPPRS
jgi:quercetin dioxygenase-like cupin family protein